MPGNFAPCNMLNLSPVDVRMLPCVAGGEQCVAGSGWRLADVCDVLLVVRVFVGRGGESDRQLGEYIG